MRINTAELRDYQQKPFRRGKEPSTFYRQTHPFPTRKETFGNPEYVTKDGVQMRTADGTDTISGTSRMGASYRMFYYRIPRTPRGKVKPQMSATIGRTLIFHDAKDEKRVYVGEVYRHTGQMYGKGNTGTIWMRNVRLSL